MRIVCDTNVLVSGVLFGGASRQILVLASRGKLSNFISREILREVEEVLARPKFKLSAAQVLSITQVFRDTFELVVPSSSVTMVESDPADDRILEAALEAKAEAIVSGDKHLLCLRTWQGIRIVSPADFIAQYSATST